jgi:hypothetical protein
MMTEKMKIDKKKAKELEGHTLKTRRDFIAHGFLGGLATVMAPTLLTALTSSAAHALDCGTATSIVNGIPIIIFDLAGGSNIAGSNVLVGKAGGQLDFLTSYETLGLPQDMHPKNAGQVNNELGLAFHSDSGILRGILGTTSTATRAKVEGGVFCAISNDDTQNNPHNPAYWLTKAGAVGDISQLTGTENTDSGGNASAPLNSIIPTLRPVTINSPKDALNLINIGRLGTLFGNDKSVKLLKAIENMSAERIKKFDRRALPDQIKDLVNCGYIQSQDALNRFLPQNIDPTLDTNVTSAFNNLNEGNQRKTATIAKMILDGHIGVGTVTIGGCDYHTDERATGEAKDFQIGDLIGRVLELAAKKQKDIIVYVVTDGGVSSNNKIDSSAGGRGKLGWGGDNGIRSASFMLYYRNAGKAQLRRANGRQIGFYKDSANIDGAASLISNSVTNLSKAVVANYLALSGKENTLETIVGDNPFSSDLDKYIIFNKSV